VEEADVTVRGEKAGNSGDAKAAYAEKNASGVLYRDAYGKITQTEGVANLRVLFSTVLKFGCSANVSGL
jgi:hypothetical protein